MLGKPQIQFDEFIRYTCFILLGLVIGPYLLSYTSLILNTSKVLEEDTLVIFAIGIIAFFYFGLSVIYRKEYFLGLSASLIIFGLSFFISSNIIDFSFDGQGYHQEAIFSIVNGWNFLYEGPPRNVSELWINHYPKAQWMSGAYYFSLFGDIEGAKLVNWLLVFSKFLLALLLLKSIGFKKPWLVLCLSLVVAFDPINLNTILSHTNDGQVSSVLFILFGLLILNVQKGNQKYPFFLIILVAIYALNIKFNAFVYVFFLLGSFILYSVFVKNNNAFKSSVLVSIVSLVFGLSIFGFNPYIKNLINTGYIFYPVIANQENTSQELAHEYLPIDLEGHNNLVKLIKSSFARTSFSQSFNGAIQYKIPFTVNKYEITRYAGTGVMIGGLGVLFSGLLFFSLVTIFLLMREKNYLPIFIITMIFISVVINPLCWWNRFVPQFWFVPIVALLYLYKTDRYRKFSHVFLFTVMANLFLMSGYFVYNFTASRGLNQTMTEISSSQSIKKSTVLVKFNKHLSSFKYKLDKYNIKYSSLSTLSCDNQLKLKLIDAKICIEE